MIWHTSSAKDVLNELKTDSQNGLSGAEVNSRLAKYGKNLPDKKRERTFKELFLSQLKDVPTVVLTVAAILYFIIALITPENSDISTSVAEPIIILLIVVINAVTGALQQTGAEAAVESLKFISPPSATVVRNGKTVYYGNMTDKYVIKMEIKSSKKVDDLEVADKVAVSLIHTDDNMSPKDRIIKSSEKDGLYEALDLGAIWLKRALSE